MSEVQGGMSHFLLDCGDEGEMSPFMSWNGRFLRSHEGMRDAAELPLSRGEGELVWDEAESPSFTLSPPCTR